MNEALVRERGERGRVEREREGVRSEVKRERRGRETAEGKVEEMNKVVAEKSDDIQAKARMIAKVRVLYICRKVLEPLY